MDISKIDTLLSFPVVVTESQLDRVYAWDGTDTIHVYTGSLDYVHEHDVGDETTGYLTPTQAEMIIQDCIDRQKKELEKHMEREGVI